MKITDLFESVRIVLSNEEQEFVKHHGHKIFVSSLDQHANWVAQNLVRKGIYEISNDDNKQLVKAKNVFYNHSSSLR
jgi:hypothetical protein